MASSRTARVDSQEYPDYMLKLHVKYTYLDTTQLAELLRLLASLHKSVLAPTSEVYYQADEDIAYRNILEIDELRTGNSIIVQLKEGWQPEFRIEKDDLTIRVPKKLGIPILMGYFIFKVVDAGYDLANKSLDNEIKQYEREIKKLELYEKLEQHYRFPPRYQRHRSDARQVVNLLERSDSIYFVELNDVPIINVTFNVQVQRFV